MMTLVPTLRALSCSLMFVGLGLTLVSPAPVYAVQDQSTFKESDNRRAGLGPREPALTVEFPNAARVRGVSHGRAEASVLVDADGMPLDFLVTSQTDAAFGRALLDHLKTLAYQPAKMRGRPVPARCGFSYEFTAQQATGMNVLDASASKNLLGQAKPILTPVVESKLDHPLEIIDGVVPTQPKGYPRPDKPLKISVTFFVDESGQLRTPNVESAGAPELLAPVIGALSTWKFKVPTVGGKPALVYAGRTFLLAQAP